MSEPSSKVIGSEKWSKTVSKVRRGSGTKGRGQGSGRGKVFSASASRTTSSYRELFHSVNNII